MIFWTGCKWWQLVWKNLSSPASLFTLEARTNELLWPLYTLMLSFIAKTGMHGPCLLHNTVCDISEWYCGIGNAGHDHHYYISIHQALPSSILSLTATSCFWCCLQYYSWICRAGINTRILWIDSLKIKKKIQSCVRTEASYCAPKISIFPYKFDGFRPWQGLAMVSTAHDGWRNVH